MANHSFRPSDRRAMTSPPFTLCEVRGCYLDREHHPATEEPTPVVAGEGTSPWYIKALLVVFLVALLVVMVFMGWFLADTLIKALVTITVPTKP